MFVGGLGCVAHMAMALTAKKGVGAGKAVGAAGKAFTAQGVV